MFALVLVAAVAGAAPPAKEKCPVCGMFVAKYPEWTASVTLRGGKVYYFDGAKDLFRFCLDLQKYAPGKAAADVAAVTVLDYYSLEPIDGRRALYVLGSDVYGPMGKELIPFASRKDAEGFSRDHRGTKILSFGDIRPPVLKLLE